MTTRAQVLDLGLLEIARRSSTPISYEFVEVNNDEVDFYISAMV